MGRVALLWLALVSLQWQQCTSGFGDKEGMQTDLDDVDSTTLRCGIQIYPQPPAWNGIPWVHDVFAGANATKAYVIADYRGVCHPEVSSTTICDRRPVLARFTDSRGLRPQLQAQNITFRAPPGFCYKYK
jgi:hypothetical protein